MIPQHYKYQKQMIYELALHLPYWNYNNADYETNEVHKHNLDSITDLEKKLIYYNKNIKSLSTHSMEARVNFRWGNPDQLIKVFCNCSKCRSLPDFDPVHEKLYFALRDAEVKRIQSKIEILSTYKEKLQFVFSIKGYHPDQTPRIWSNMPYDPLGNNDRDMLFSEPIIDLTPKSKHEIETYNQFIQIAFNKRFRNNEEFTGLYNGFVFSVEKKRLNTTLLRAEEPEVLLEYIKKEIEKAFDYPASTQKEQKKNDHINELYDQFSPLRLAKPPLLFAQMCLGIEYNSETNLVDEHALFHYTHTNEVFEYFKYVKKLLEKGVETIELEENITETDMLKSDSRKAIVYHLDSLHNSTGWEYAFFNEQDYELFIKLLTTFFDSGKCKLPKSAINLKRNTKTEISKALKKIYNQMPVKKALKNNTDFYNLIRCLSPFSTLNDDQIYRALMK